MTLLVLGWKPRFEEYLPDLGLDTVVVLGEEERQRFGEVARRYGTIIDLPDKSDVGRLLPALARRGYRPGDISHVYTDQETPMVPGALAAAHFGASGMTVSTAILARDKFLQKQAVARAGLGVTEHHLIPADPAERERLLRSLGYPIVIKPISAWGSRHITVASDAEQALATTAAIQPGLPDADSFLAEGLVTGRELHADAIIVDKQLPFLSVSRYFANVLTARATATVGSYVLEPGSPEYPEAAALVLGVAEALGLDAATVHLEYFETDHGLVFSECAARTGGTWVTDTVREKFGVDIRRAAIEAALGRPLSVQGVGTPATVGWSYLPLPAGLISELPAESELAGLPGVRRVAVYPGLVGTHSEGSRPGGLVIVEGADLPALRARLAEVLDRFTSRVRLTGA